MKHLRPLYGLMILLIVSLSSCSDEDDSPGNEVANSNLITVNSQTFTITSVSVSWNFDPVIWSVTLADEAYALHVDDLDYEGAGVGLTIEYTASSGEYEYSCCSGFARLMLYQDGEVYFTDDQGFDLNVTVSGKMVTFDARGEDENNSSFQFSAFYEGSTDIFNN